MGRAMCRVEKPILRFERREREKEEIKNEPVKEKKEKKKWYYRSATMKIIIVYGKELPFFFGICKNLLYGNFLLFLYVKCR